MTIDWRFSLLLLALTLINYYAGCAISRFSDKSIQKLSVTISVVLSLAILFYFKYANFFIDSFMALFSFGATTRDQPIINVILPVGISFMTFQSITYPIDLYSNKLKHQATLKDFCLFMAFFPQLLSGPIVRASYFIPQLENNQGFNGKNMLEGMALAVKGLVKKVIIADILAAQIVDPAFENPELYSPLFLAIAIIAFSFQVYMDLSGYTDIALGVGRMIGYKLPINFNQPYLATSIANYWQRWHISMSSFFRDYLYEPISSWTWCNLYTKLLLVFISIGLWHGAGWNFVLYGFIHGSLVTFEHYKKSKRSEAGEPLVVYRGTRLAIRTAQIFLIVSVTRILFRGGSLSESLHYIQTIFFSESNLMPISLISGITLLLAGISQFSPIAWRDKVMKYFITMPSPISAGFIVLTFYFLIAFGTNKVSFIYFQF